MESENLVTWKPYNTAHNILELFKIYYKLDSLEEKRNMISSIKKQCIRVASQTV